MAIRSIEANRRHDQVRSHAHDTLQIGWFGGVLLIDLALALRIPELLHP